MGLKVLNCLSHVPNPPNSTSGFPGAEEEVPRAPRIECVGLSQGNFRREEWGWVGVGVGASKEVGIFKSSRKFPRGSPIYYLPDEGKKPLAKQALLAALPPTTLIPVWGEGRWVQNSTSGWRGGECRWTESRDYPHSSRKAGRGGREKVGKVYCYQNEGFA